MPVKTMESVRFRLAKADIPNGDGTAYPLQMLIEMAMKDPHLEMIGTELWYRDTIPNIKPSNREYKIVLVHPFDTYPTCTKCGHIHLFDKAKVRYDAGFDKLEKTCITCGFSWWEELYPFRKNKDKNK